jgi:ATP-binding cassette subfamily B protein
VTATATETAPEGGDAAPSGQSVLPELRTMWWETGVRARASAGVIAVVTQLPRLIATAIGVSWRADRRRTAVVFVCTVGSGAMAAFGLLATQRVLVELFAGGPTPDRIAAALPALVVLAVATGIRAGFGIATGYAQNGLTPRVDREIQRGLFEATTAVRLAAFDEDAFADDMERAGNGTDYAIELVRGAIDLLAGVAGLAAVMLAVTLIHPLLLVALLVATVPQAWASLRAGHLRYRTYMAGSVRRRRLYILHRLMAERNTATELRSYGLRDFLLDQYDRVMAVEMRIQLDLARRMTTTISMGSVIGGLATGAVYALLGLLLLNGQIPLSAAATCVIAVQAALRSLSTVTYQIDEIYGAGQHFSDYTGFMARAAKQMPDLSGTEDPGPLRHVAVRAASLRYPDRETPAVREVSLTIASGQTVAFVGENGSGKTTLAAMIAGLRAPDGGEVTWNDRSLSTMDSSALRRRIAVVTQDFHRWPFTAATNIAIGNTSLDPDRGRIEAAARRAAAHDMIRELPYGYETLLDRTFAQGQDLSGGQWQRITAARGFLRDAELLIMDEPSSALDPRAEDALFQAIRDRQGRGTTILITHRLANVRHADVIYVLHEGALVEQGSHDELVAAGGRYAELFELQAAGYRAA